MGKPHVTHKIYWDREKRAKRIYKALTTTDLTFKEIVKRYAGGASRITTYLWLKQFHPEYYER
jgi:hypothetical protein